MKRGGCTFGNGKTRGHPLSKRGAVVSQLVLKLKESVPPRVPHTPTRSDLSWLMSDGTRHRIKTKDGPINRIGNEYFRYAALFMAGF